MPAMTPNSDVGLSDASSPLAYDMTPRSTPASGTGIPAETPKSAVSRTSLTSAVPRTPSSAVGSAMTPRDRGEIGQRSRHFLTPRTGDDQDEKMLSSEQGAEMSGSLVWGTTVSVQNSINRFIKFFEEFKDPKTGEPLYPRLLEEIIDQDRKHLNLDCRNLHAFDEDLYKELKFYPQEIIPVFDMCIERIIRTKYPDQASMREKTQVRTFNLLESTMMRELDPEDIDTMVSVKGMVIRCSSIIPDMMSAFFECAVCGNTHEVAIERGRIEEPVVCSNCSTRHSMKIIHNRCGFSDKQIVKLQETPDSLKQGETPHTISVFIYGDLCDVAKPGDRVEITGIFRTKPKRINPRQRAQHAIFDTYIDVLHIKKSNKNEISAEDAAANKDSEFFTSFEESDELGTISKEKEAKFREMAADPAIYQKLVDSLAPSVYEMVDIKKGILCQLFSGANKVLGDRGRFRGEINVLLCGDPGVSKSQLLKYVHKIAPRGIYTSGKGSSAVGLTAYITKDPATGEMVLESGALVLSDRGICCIDEFDKMSDSTRSILHEVMEQQTVSLAKAGIVCTLNARTSILASANPINSRYDTSKSVIANLNLIPTILSRFDLIYLILDKPSEQLDRRLAKHLVSMYFKEPPSEKKDVIPVSLLTEYISYAKQHITPVLTDEAAEEIISAYVEMRRVGQISRSKVVTATTRQLESLIRLSEAQAKMRLSKEVKLEHVYEAKRLISVATCSAATDPNTGLIDMDLITTGQSAEQRKRMDLQAAAVKDIIKGHSGNQMTIDSILKEWKDGSDLLVSEKQLRAVLSLLEEEGFLKHTKGRRAIRCLN